MTQNQTSQLDQIATDAFTFIARLILRHPNDLEVVANLVGPNLLAIEASCNFADFGMLRGKNKRTIEAISNIIKLIGFKNSAIFRVNNLLPPKIGQAEPLPDIIYSRAWNSGKTVEQFKEIVNLFAKEHFKVEVRENNDDFKTRIKLVSTEKFHFALMQIAFDLSTIFHIYGKLNGRSITVEACVAPTKN